MRNVAESVTAYKGPSFRRSGKLSYAPRIAADKTAETVTAADLQMIDNFAGLNAVNRRAMLDMVREMLHEEMQILPESK